MSAIGYFDSVLSDQGKPIVASITVYDAGTPDKATIYVDPEGLVEKDNPFQADALGRFQFFASAGQYDVEVSGTGITTYKIQYISLAEITQSTELTDMPGSFSGQAGKALRVKVDESGYELFVPEAGEGIPSGLISIFDTACPSGWTRLSGWDGKFLRGAASYGETGGTTDHQHGVGSYAVLSAGSHQHQVDPPITTSSMSANTTVQSGSGAGVAAQDHTHTIDITAFASGAAGAHEHSLSGSSAAADHIPPYIDVVFCKKN